MSDIKKLMAAHHEKLLAACVEYRAKLDELERENAAQQALWICECALDDE